MMRLRDVLHEGCSLSFKDCSINCYDGVGAWRRASAGMRAEIVSGRMAPYLQREKNRRLYRL